MTPGTSASPLVDLDAALRRLGYETFRPGQREAIETLLDRGRLLLVAPTGGGKSLTYQLPATLLPGTTLVVSPLVSLMHDQVAALAARGVAATFLASTLDAGEMRRRLGALARGAFKLVYVAPERLAMPGFRAMLGALACPLVAVDEAHCISEWGHDFRPEYLELGALLAELRPPRVLACTATATPVVRDEIVARLGLPPDTPQLLRGFARPNLALRAREVSGGRDRSREVDRTLAEALGAPGAGRGRAIVYAATRKAAEAEATRLAGAGWRCQAYHAGLDGATRERVQREFSDGHVEIVVATNAFGMGIDRPDVRAVVHLSPPGSLEAYYQEVGRAGRDGDEAVGLLLMSPSDLPLRRALLERGGDDGPVDAAVVEHKWGLFLELVRWADGGSCRHDAILRYFGDESETLAGCGRCDVCRALAGSATVEDADTASLIVRKALSGVARVHDRFGLGLAVKLVRGVADPRLERAGLTGVRTFGNLREHSEEWLLRLLRRCVAAGWVGFSGGDRPVVRLTDDGRAVMHGTRPARILLPPLGRDGRRAATRGSVSGADAARARPGPGDAEPPRAERAVAEAASVERRDALSTRSGQRDADSTGAGRPEAPGTRPERDDAESASPGRRDAGSTGAERGDVPCTSAERRDGEWASPGRAVKRADAEGAAARGALVPRRPRGDDETLDLTGEAVFEALRRYRLETAREAAVPPYVVASDRTLRDIARLRPSTLSDLELAHGIGAQKRERYGADLLRVVREALAAAASHAER